MSNEGFFKIWRELFDKPIWLNSSPEHKSILFTILKMAKWKEEQWEWKGKKYYCKPGEFITSIGKIQIASGKGISRQNVRSGLNRLKKLDFLTYQSTDGYKDGIKVIINNWGIYQAETNQPSNQLPTPNKEYKNNIYNTKEYIYNTHTSKNVCVENKISDADLKILRNYAKENGAKRIKPYVAKLIENGGYLDILKEEKEKIAKAERQKAKEIIPPAEKIQQDAPEDIEKARAKARAKVTQIRKGENK